MNEPSPDSPATFDSPSDGFVDTGARISALKATKRDPGRVTVVVNGRAAGTLPRAIAAEAGASIGADWTAELASRVELAVADDKARRAALRTLERRALSRGELVERLVRKGHQRATAERITEQLESIGAIDDEAYGRMVLRQLNLSKPAGPRLMRQKLFQRRIERSLADRLIAEATRDAADDPDREREVERMVERKLASMAHLDDQARARRLFGLLARRGFDADEARRIVHRFVTRPDG